MLSYAPLQAVLQSTDRQRDWGDINVRINLSSERQICSSCASLFCAQRYTPEYRAIPHGASDSRLNLRVSSSIQRNNIPPTGTENSRNSQSAPPAALPPLTAQSMLSFPVNSPFPEKSPSLVPPSSVFIAPPSSSPPVDSFRCTLSLFFQQQSPCHVVVADHDGASAGTSSSSEFRAR